MADIPNIPRIKPEDVASTFSNFLENLGAGSVDRVVSERMHELVSACRESGQRGSITLTITVSPEDQEGVMTAADRQRLRRLAESATPGPWPAMTWYGSEDGGHAAIGPHHEKQPLREGDDGYSADYTEYEEDDAGSPVEERALRDAAFISAANPTAVLALLDALARAEAERDEAVRHRAATNDEIRNLHAMIKRGGFSVEDSVALHLFRAEAERLRALLGEAVSAIDCLLSSAVPHPTEHPGMTAAWRVGRDTLARIDLARAGKDGAK